MDILLGPAGCRVLHAPPPAPRVRARLLALPGAAAAACPCPLAVPPPPPRAPALAGDPHAPPRLARVVAAAAKSRLLTTQLPPHCARSRTHGHAKTTAAIVDTLVRGNLEDYSLGKRWSGPSRPVAMHTLKEGEGQWRRRDMSSLVGLHCGWHACGARHGRRAGEGRAGPTESACMGVPAAR